MSAADVQQYIESQQGEFRAVCERLQAEISAELPDAENKVWHGAPVWFLDGNPVVGYWVRKQHVQLLFWSGQSFDEPSLKQEGSFKAAEAHYSAADEVDSEALTRWLKKARRIQWDYKNIVKNRGELQLLKDEL